MIGPKEDYITDVDVVRYTKQRGKNVSQHGSNISQPQYYHIQSFKAPYVLPIFSHLMQVKQIFSSSKLLMKTPTVCFPS